MDINEDDILQKINRSERKSQARMLILLIICVLLGLGIVYYVQQNAQQARKIDELNTAMENLANYNSHIIDSLRKSNNALLKSIDSLKTIKDTLAKSIRQSNVRLPTNLREYTQIPQNLAKNDLEFKAKMLKLNQKTTVYIQQNGKLAQVVAQSLLNRLRQIGYDAPGIERVKQEENRITYFFDADRKVAEDVYQELKQILRVANIPFDEKQFAPQPQSNPKAQKGKIEVWISY